jgi:hypothetical protein
MTTLREIISNVKPEDISYDRFYNEDIRYFAAHLNIFDKLKEDENKRFGTYWLSAFYEDECEWIGSRLYFLDGKFIFLAKYNNRLDKKLRFASKDAFYNFKSFINSLIYKKEAEDEKIIVLDLDRSLGDGYSVESSYQIINDMHSGIHSEAIYKPSNETVRVLYPISDSDDVLVKFLSGEDKKVHYKDLLLPWGFSENNN